jgi:hypothetical protein
MHKSPVLTFQIIGITLRVIDHGIEISALFTVPQRATESGVFQPSVRIVRHRHLHCVYPRRARRT